MPENELLKKINKELKVISVENSEKQARDKSEASEEEIDENPETELQQDNTEEIEEINNELVELAEEQTDDVVDALKTNVLSSDPNNLVNQEIPVERNEIDAVNDDSGILNDHKSDKTAAFIDPDSEDENFTKLKVVDTSLGVFTILNHDKDSVLLLDSNKQKIQISIDDFNSLHPFEVKDDELENVNSFKDALIRDKENEKAKEETSEVAEEEDNADLEADNEPEELNDNEIEEDIDENELGFGESVVHNVVSKPQQQETNVLNEIQQNLSKKKGVVETIRSDVRGKNRCVLNAKQAKLKETTEFVPKTKQKKTFVGEEKTKTPTQYIKNENKKKKEATQPSNICITPKPLSDKNSDFNVNDIVTLKDGKFVLVKLEGSDRKCYLKLKPKKDLSITKFRKDLINVSSFFESLDYITDNFVILEKELVMIRNRRFRKFESEDVEDQELELEDELEVDDDDLEEEDVDVDVEDDEEEVEEDLEEDEEQPESIEYSTEINGVKYVGVLYAQNDSDEESEEDTEAEDEEESEEEIQDEADEGLILSSEEELEDLSLEAKEEGVINARAKIFGKRYNVTFGGLKAESVRKVKSEMRRHNIVEAWNTLVRGAKIIK